MKIFQLVQGWGLLPYRASYSDEIFTRVPDVTTNGTVLVRVGTLAHSNSSAYISWDTRMYCQEHTILFSRVPIYIVLKRYVLL